jgi:type I restriction enzyme S subunit
LIINRVNSVSHLGKCMLVPEGFDGALFESNMMRCSVSDLVVEEVLVAYLNSEFGRRRATKNCKHAVNQASINQDDVAEIPIPLPPLAEQQALVDAIRLEMSKLPADIDAVSKLAAALRQSLLRDAFAGLIVPQDPTDEPASTLLERIAAQRSDCESPRKRVPKPLRRKNVKA